MGRHNRNTCPVVVQALIDCANLAGPQLLPSVADLWRFPAVLDPTDWMNAVAEAARDRPPAFRRHLGPFDHATFPTVVARWDAVCRAQRILLAIVETATASSAIDVTEATGVQAAKLRRAPDGRLHVDMSVDLARLQGIDAARLTRCAHCHDFMWMQRRRLHARGPWCSGACKQAAWRENHPEQHAQLQAVHESRRAAKEAKEAAARRLSRRIRA